MILQLFIKKSLPLRNISKLAQLISKIVVAFYLKVFPHYSLSIIKFKELQGTNPKPIKKLNGKIIYLLKLKEVPIMPIVLIPHANIVIFLLP